MFTIMMLYRRAPLLGKIFMIALFLLVFLRGLGLFQTSKPKHQIPERNSNVHTPRSAQ
ncbi:hypothetical protein HDF16_006395 [Granulicella aggregans]|uniref:Uncharacterized protein n=1 Tax=Granulicella aggregans TaxID=474949 RepID=A0A7W7ZKK2_9BACT|nr:hypothetical protein [Granulicella aggregans]